jgi:hypothetical protein
MQALFGNQHSVLDALACLFAERGCMHAEGTTLTSLRAMQASLRGSSWLATLHTETP